MVPTSRTHSTSAVGISTGATATDVERPLSLLEGRLRTREGEPIVSFRVGVAPYDPERHKSVRALVHDADLLMYEGKRSRTTERPATH